MEYIDDNDSELKQKIKTALAIAVIKSKPEGCSLRQHVFNYQEAVQKRDDQINEFQVSTGSFDIRKRIHILQHKLLWGVLPLEYHKNSCKAVVDPKNPAADVGTSEDIFEETEFHIQFIQAMVQLKSTINSCSSVKTSTFHNIMRSIPCDNTSNQCHIYTNHNFHHESQAPLLSFNGQKNSFNSRDGTELTDDSGYDSIAVCSSSVREGDVSSTMLKYLIHNSDANQVLLESVNTVLKHLETILSNKDIICLKAHLENWKGSLLEDAASVLKNIVNLLHQDETVSASHSLCLKFIKKIICSIIEDSQNTKFADFEYRCMAVSELCENNFLCCDTIDFLLENVVLISNASDESFAVDFSESGNCLDLDRHFFIFHLLKILIKKYLKMNQDFMKIGPTSNKKENCTDLTELWKHNFTSSLNVSANKRNSNFNCNLKILEWKKILEECTCQFFQKSPKLTFSCSCCLNVFRKQLHFNGS